MPCSPVEEKDSSKSVRNIQILGPQTAILRVRDRQSANSIFKGLSRLIYISKLDGGKDAYRFKLETGSKNESTKIFADPSETMIINGNLKEAMTLLSKELELISNTTYDNVIRDIEQMNKELYDIDEHESKETPSSKPGG